MSAGHPNPSPTHSHPHGHSDRIEKEVLLRAPRSRVWRAISDSVEFGSWFGVSFQAPFVAGQIAKGRIVKPEKLSHLVFDFVVEEVKPERLFSYRWHPAAIDSSVDYSKEKTTLVTFTLEDAPGGTLLKVSETGFDALPPERRAYAFGLNESGWIEQMDRVAKHVAQDS